MYDCVNMYKVHKRVKASGGDTLYPPYPLKTITTYLFINEKLCKQQCNKC